jgi:hypothetical protein
VVEVTVVKIVLALLFHVTIPGPHGAQRDGCDGNSPHVSNILH